MILQKQNLYLYKLISVNILYHYKVSTKYCILYDKMMHCLLVSGYAWIVV